MARIAEVMLLLMFLMLIFSVHLASAARLLEGEGWREGGIGTGGDSHSCYKMEFVSKVESVILCSKFKYKEEG
ncbi:hypothetical protein TRIUR3_13042 [Triticum urartu]|uniref:Uncharacterized protein n=2 Tax=Triticum TaxID=4564 RepID=A0A9R1NV10_TRITD|nr:hypothetical protein TRIUR3_13042 [Triticum urartu]VAH31517.1 unnamed protein product [Triticum turgidum subsp. durum]